MKNQNSTIRKPYSEYDGLNILVISENIKMEIIPDEEHIFLVHGKEMARAIGLNENSLKTNKHNHKNTLQRGIHFVGNNPTYWTYKGLLWYSQHMQGGFANEMHDWYIREMSNNRPEYYQITDNQMVDIMHDVCKIEDMSLRLSIAKKLLDN